jgi:metal-responsive CopG/Arc/MetJ family transcriptional regulator
MEKISVSFPKELLEEVRRFVPPRQRSQIIAEGTSRMIALFKQQKAAKEAAGLWKEKDHPELAEGVDLYLRNLRASWGAKR